MFSVGDKVKVTGTIGDDGDSTMIGRVGIINEVDMEKIYPAGVAFPEGDSMVFWLEELTKVD